MIYIIKKVKIDKKKLLITFLMLLVKKNSFLWLLNQKKFLPLHSKILIINI